MSTQDVIVIGAGISGLACAEYLKTHGNTTYNVTVLEASDRIGGRIKTLQLGNNIVEIGAAWVHGVGNNPLTQVSKDIGMSLGPSGEDCIFVQCSPESARDYLCIGPDGEDCTKLVTEWQLSFSDFFDETLVNESEEMQKKGVAKDKRVSDALQAVLNNSDFKKKWVQKLGSEKLFNMLSGFSVENLEAFFAVRLNNLSLKWMEDFGERREDDGESIVTGGYETLVKAIAKNVSNIKLNHQVTHIIQNGQKIKVVTNKGDFVGDRVVVTVPLGYLKAKKISFEPPLPRRKQEAIDRLGFGVLGKVVLQFTDAFWPPNATWIEHISSDGFTAFIYNIYARTKQPILVVHTSPSVNEKRRRENLTDDQMTQAYLKVLASHFGPQAHKKFVRSYVTDWDVHPWSLGSYSCLAFGSEGGDYDVMAEPLNNNRVLFAGEATWREHPATTDGAYLSGQREAKRIIETPTVTSKL